MVVAGEPMRISCDSEPTAARIRGGLGAVAGDGSSPLGFVVRSPSGRNRLYVLTDRCGFVLGRSRKIDDIVATLRGLLTSFVPAPTGTQRLRMRSMYDGESALLFVPPLLFAETPIERQLVRSGLALIDRLVVDIDAATLRVQAPRTASGVGSSLRSGTGHVAPTELDQLGVSGTFLPGPAAPIGTSTPAEQAAVIAACALGGSRAQAIDVAIRLVPLAALVPAAGGLRALIAHLANR